MKSKDKDKLITEWIKELRSNHYQQGQGYLCKNDRYCCLGVLCEISKKQGIITSREICQIGFGSEFVTFEGEKDWLPQILADEIFNGNTNPFIQGQGVLADLNDAGFDFKRIANIIEKAFKQKKLPYQMRKK